jgi:predicted transport protein
VNTFFSSGNKRSYNDFKENISPQIQSLFDSLRDFCFSLGSNVIEDVRMHRVVFCKSITFRWFVDMEPQKDSILLKIQRNRKEPLSTMKIKDDDNLDQVKEFLRDAYITIH